MHARIGGIGVLLSILLLAGCSTRVTDFTVISTKSLGMDWSQKGHERVVGSHCRPVILVPLGVPNLKDAIDDAIEKAGTGYDALIDGVVYQRNKSFIFGSLCFEVEGTPVSTKRRTGLLPGETGPGEVAVLYHSRLGIPNDLSHIPFVDEE